MLYFYMYFYLDMKLISIYDFARMVTALIRCNSFLVCGTESKALGLKQRQESGKCLFWGLTHSAFSVNQKQGGDLMARSTCK